jgi:hypothetical protein
MTPVINMTKREYFVLGAFAALALWTWHLSSELSATDRRLDATMEQLMDLRIDLWDKHYLGPNDPDPLNLFRDKKDNKGQDDPLGLFQKK